MFEEVHHITLSGKEIPIKCDILVLERLQQKYGSLSVFEREILNWEYEKDADGKKKKTRVAKEPNIEAVLYALYEMAKEGAVIEGIEIGQREDFMRKIDVQFMDLASAVHDEFAFGFSEKNGVTTQKRTTEKNKEG